MEINQASEAFAALSQNMRLSALKTLLKAGENGLLAGELASKLGARPNTLSANLTILTNAGLIVRNREGRNIRYIANMNSIRRLLGFLLQDCCGGQPELCQPVLNELSLSPRDAA